MLPETKKIEWTAWSKIVQVNETDVYVIGGECKSGNSSKDTIKLNVRTGEVIKCDSLL